MKVIEVLVSDKFNNDEHSLLDALNMDAYVGDAVKRKVFTVHSTAAMQMVVAHIVTLSCWFAVTPLPDDEYEIAVKADMTRAAFGAYTK